MTREVRRDVVVQAVRDFDADLERDTTVEPERLTRARDNTRALRGLMQDMERANVEQAD